MFEMITKVIDKPGRKPRKPSDKHLPIFERIKGRSMDALRQGIVEAKYRFHEEDAETANKLKTSKCWKVDKVNINNPGQDELVYVGIPCGKKYMPFLQDDQGNSVSTNLIASDKVVAQLEAFLVALEAMQKTSPQGKIFHQQAIESSEPPKQKGKPEHKKEIKYDAATDQWVKAPKS